MGKKLRKTPSNLADETKADIIIGTETWLKPGEDGHKDSELMLDDYDIFRRDRPSRGGGVLIAVKKSLSCEHISSSKDSETIFCKVKLKGKRPLIIGSVYRPPDYDFDQSKTVANEIYNIINKNKGAVFWFGGDFNIPDINWKKQDIFGNKYPKPINCLFLEMSQDLGLSQINNNPTRGTSILDLLFTNNPDYVKNCNLLAGLGDHEVIQAKISLDPIRKKPTKRRIHLWNRVDEAKIQEDTHELRNRFLILFSASDSVIDMWNFIKKEFTFIIDDNVPTKETSTKVHQPWITTETKQLIRKKNRWFKKAKETNSPRVWKIYRQVKAETQKTIRKTHDRYLNDIFTDDTSNKKLWSYIKSRKQDNVGIPDLKDHNNILTNDPVKKADLIHRQFDSVFSDPSSKIKANLNEKERLPSMNPIKITRPGILKLLNNINPNKAIGPDCIPGKFLKLCADDVADIYTVLFQASLDQGIVPPDWKTANVVPFFKKGDKSLPENYRPIFLTSLSCKLLEHVVHSNISTHFEEFDVLENAQHGFRKRRSCISQLINTLDDFANCLKNHQQIDAILLDFSKAFDKVDHEGLILKLEHLGIRGSLLDWTKSFLIDRTQRVVVEGKGSSPTRVQSGVPQGTVLGPLFFLVYINDITKGLSKGTILNLFADDSLLYRIIKSAKDAEILQKDLLTLQLWEKKWKMEFHPGKCQLLKITNKIKPINTVYKIHNIPISETDSAKYLGVVIDSNLHWRYQYSNIIKKCNSTLAFLKRNLSKSPNFVKDKCYKALVRPKIEYACAIWDPYHQNHIEDIEKVQKRAARFVTGNYLMETGNSKLNLDRLGWPTLEERRLQTKLITFQKCRLKHIDVPTDHLTFKIRQTRLGGDGQTYQRIFSDIDGHIYSFFPHTSLLWNLLSPEVRMSTNVDFFTTQVKSLSLVDLKNKLSVFKP